MKFTRGKVVAVLISAVVLAGAAQSPATAAGPAGSESGLSAAQERQLDQRIQTELARVPGGTKIGPNEIAWDDGNVVMTLGVADAKGLARAYGRCDAGWYCVYEAWYWNEYDRNLRKLRFRDCRSYGYYNNLNDYGFANKTSSWDNRTRAYVDVYDGGGSYIFTMQANARSAEVPAGANDRATHMYAYC